MVDLPSALRFEHTSAMDAALRARRSGGLWLAVRSWPCVLHGGAVGAADRAARSARKQDLLSAADAAGVDANGGDASFRSAPNSLGRCVLSPPDLFVADRGCSVAFIAASLAGSDRQSRWVLVAGQFRGWIDSTDVAA